MYEYSHGGNAAFEDGRQGSLDLSANINPLGMPDGVRRACLDALADAERYPDSFSTRLREGIAEFEHVNPEWLFCGNGASDVIFRLPRAVKARQVLVTAPTFSDYERAALSYGSMVVRHSLAPENDFDLTPSLIEAVKRAKPGLVFICSPNNPTGRLADIKLIAELLKLTERQGGRLVVDECFIDFAESAQAASAKQFLADFPNLVVLKAFTKTFAMPGIRLGYAISASPKLIEGLYFHGADWAVGNLAQAAGIAALEAASDYIARSQAYISHERAYLQQSLSALGYRVFESQANYVLIQSPFGLDLVGLLDEAGIRIRPCANYYGLDESYYRIAVSTAESNSRLLEALQAITPGGRR